MNKPKTIFDLLTDITFNKVGWDKQTDHDKKQFSPYMINRLLSMDHNMIELVNYIQQYKLQSFHHYLKPKLNFLF